MCWSGEASTVLAAVGIGTAVYAAVKKQPPALWMTLGYFSLMELLQAYTYAVIDQCESPSNQIATLLGYLHIAFQPFFINAISMHFIPKEVRDKIQPAVYAACFASAIVMIIQLYPMDWAGACDPSRPLCGETLCSISGNWHIAWVLPTNGIGNFFVNWDNILHIMFDEGYATYVLVGFIIPIIYGSWRITVYHYFAGPFLSRLLTDNVNEQPAVWCLLSIGILLIVVKTPLRKVLHVNRWWFWKRTTPVGNNY